ncbi:MAG: transposase [Lewinellaceae bacterium]|nr:transposase [Lewinellaceae bacterium]
MKKQRRSFSKEFKLQVIPEALKERLTLNELSQKYEVHPNQISAWKQDFLNKAEQVFSSPAPNAVDNESQTEQYEQGIVDGVILQKRHKNRAVLPNR